MSNPTAIYALILVQPVPKNINDHPYAHVVKITEGKQIRRRLRGEFVSDPGINRLLQATIELYAPCPVTCLMKEVCWN